MAAEIEDKPRVKRRKPSSPDLLEAKVQPITSANELRELLIFDQDVGKTKQSEEIDLGWKIQLIPLCRASTLQDISHQNQT